MSGENVEAVRGLWRAFERGGIDAVLSIADEDIEWVPHQGGGRSYRGHDGLRRFMREHEGEAVTEPYSYTDYGDNVLVYGHVQRGDADQRVFWLYRFRDGRLRRFEAFTEQEAAEREALKGEALRR